MLVCKLERMACTTVRFQAHDASRRHEPLASGEDGTAAGQPHGPGAEGAAGPGAQPRARRRAAPGLPRLPGQTLPSRFVPFNST